MNNNLVLVRESSTCIRMYIPFAIVCLLLSSAIFSSTLAQPCLFPPATLWQYGGKSQPYRNGVADPVIKVCMFVDPGLRMYDPVRLLLPVDPCQYLILCLSQFLLYVPSVSSVAFCVFR